jgi:thioesterase domain-containing protein
MKRFVRLSTYFGSRRRNRQDTGTSRSSQTSLQLVFDYADAAWTHYRPRFYRGKVTFLRAGTSLRFPRNPLAMWGGLVQKLDVHTVPGDHMGMVREQADGLASCLSSCLHEAYRSQAPFAVLPERCSVRRVV